MRQSKVATATGRKGPGLLGKMLIGLCILAMAGSGALMARQVVEYRIGEDAYGELVRGVVQQPLQTAEPEDDDGIERVPPPEGGWPSVDFAALAETNADIAGWLIVPGTEINYPVVYTQDNKTYLKKLFNGRANDAGTLFFDARNQRGLVDTNTVIYGHNMKNGTMFQALTKYKDQKFFDEHPRAYLMTPEGRFAIELFAGFVTRTDDDSWQRTFASGKDYADWIARLRAKSTFESAAEMDASAQCITLSTCSYEFDNARYVVMGRLVRVE